MASFFSTIFISTTESLDLWTCCIIITLTIEIVIIPKQIQMMTSFVYMVVPKRRGLKDRSEKLKVNDKNSVGQILESSICFQFIVEGMLC